MDKSKSAYSFTCTKQKNGKKKARKNDTTPFSYIYWISTHRSMLKLGILFFCMFGVRACVCLVRPW